jgi:hypothetical protein
MVVQRRIRRDHDVGVSRSALLYLFADRFVRRSRLSSRLTGNPGVPVPCSRKLVRLVDLEESLLAWAVWELSDKLAILDVEEAPTSALRQDATVVISPTGDTTDSQSLASSLLAVVPPAGARVEAVVESWADKRAPLPLYGLVREVRRELIGAGLLADRVIAPPLWRRSFLNLVISKPVGDRRRIVALTGRFDDMVARWSAFEVSEPVKFEALLRAARLGLENSRVTSFDAWSGG